MEAAKSADLVGAQYVSPPPWHMRCDAQADTYTDSRSCDDRQASDSDPGRLPVVRLDLQPSIRQTGGSADPSSAFQVERRPVARKGEPGNSRAAQDDRAHAGRA